MLDRPNRAAVILGAGASFDVHNETVPVNRPDLRPPLAKQLFEARFWGIAQQYAGVRVLGAELGRLAQLDDRPFDLEERLGEYSSSNDFRTRRHFKDIPPYLRDLLMTVSNEYVPSPTNYINLARRLLQDGTHDICFITLNYDTLLERALRIYDPQLAIDKLDQYIAPERQAWVVKIHGSTDWAIPIPGTAASEGSANPEVALESFDPSSADVNSTIMDQRPEPSRRWRDPQTGSFFYPKLTAPLRDKVFTCPTQHTHHLGRFLQGCHKFLVIGSSGLDEDLLDFIQDNSSKEDTVVQYVNNELRATLDIRERFEARISRFRSARPRSIQPKLAANGFTRYLDTRDLEEFLAAV